MEALSARAGRSTVLAVRSGPAAVVVNVLGVEGVVNKVLTWVVEVVNSFNCGANVLDSSRFGDDVTSTRQSDQSLKLRK